jgi:hypothetical protein
VAEAGENYICQNFAEADSIFAKSINIQLFYIMRLAIVGSRTFENYDLVCAEVAPKVPIRSPKSLPLATTFL